jgi:two-component system response regulator FixJ
MAGSKVIAIVDDADAVRRSTAALVERAGHRAWTFASGDEFLARRPEALDCVLLDMGMPGLGGLNILKILAGEDDAPAVLVLTGRGDIAPVVAAMRLGAADFLEKPYAAEVLLAGIDYACALRARPRASQAARREAAARLDTLSERQRQVLQGIVAGKPNKIMAYELGLSVRTVEAYRAQVLIKLGVRGTAEAVRIALAGGLDAGGIRG